MEGDFEPYSISGILASIQMLKSGDVEGLLVDPYEFEDKVVYIGASAIGVQDIKATPMSAKTPGVFLHASMASTLLKGASLQPPSHVLTVVLIIAFTLLTTVGILLLSLSHSYQQALLPLLLAVGYSGWSIWEFGNGRIYEMSAPLLAIALSWLGSSSYLVFTEGKDKRRVRNMLSQYVSPAVLSTVVDKYENQIQAEVGKREDLTILFSDIRGFTATSENTEAEKVVEMLNTYFSAMTDVIFRHEGTLDKFIGDAIMAFWGAPILHADHADRGVTAAIEMQRALVGVNEELAGMGLPSVAIGIGLNSGDVILGNIGSERKLDYTIIGDNVNLASRLEGLTKHYGVPLIISENTHAQLRQEIPCAVVDMVRVKGKQVPIALYSPLALPGDEGDAIKTARRVAELSHKAFDHYRAQRWDDAIALYEQLPFKRLKKIFITRCREYSQHPPEEGWDGAYTMRTK
jgi:adenylate cyclase